MRLVQRCFFAGLLLLGLVTAAEAACQANGKVLFEDAFDELAPSWGTFQNYAVEGGEFVFRPPAGFNTHAFNNASLYEDVRVCVEVAMPAPAKRGGNCGGIVFWAVQDEDYYTFQVSTDGTASVWHRLKGKWVSAVQEQNLGSVRKSTRENDIEVEIVGKTATFYVNGQRFRQITGKPPAGGSQIGVIACSPVKTSSAIRFDNFVAWQPGTEGESADAGGGDASGGATSASCSAKGKTLFQDQFDELGPSWGTSNDFDVEDGKLVIHPPAGYTTTTINNASLYDDVDVCVEVTAPVAANGSCGAIVFWGEDYDNYYSAQIDTAGKVAVWRKQKGKSLSQVGEQDFRAVNRRANAVNVLRVVTAGNKAKFFVNDQLVREFTGQPPQGGWQIGLQGCSPNDSAARMQFDNFIVSTPGGT